jgi:hypothetical protein
MYCICSNRTFEEIVADQKQAWLPFEQSIERYTNCNSGCGSCVAELYLRFESEGVLQPASYALAK